MILDVILEQRFQRISNGSVWTNVLSWQTIFENYLKIFKGINVIARIKDVSTLEPNYYQINNSKITFTAIPHYIGLTEYVINFFKIRSSLIKALGTENALIVRAPSQIANSAIFNILKLHKPFGVEVVGDPFDVFAKGCIKHPLRPILRLISTNNLRILCHHASAAAYVTDNYLQKRYPCPAYSVGVSDVEIHSYHESKVIRRLDEYRHKSSWRLIFIGSLEQLYKGPEVLIEAVARCIKSGKKLELYIVGDGKYKDYLVNLTRELNISDLVHFLGMLPSGFSVQQQLLSSDLFVLPSRTEGLPRALIEAMACGLPCISTNVGGIPELLPAEDLVSPGDSQALSEMINEVTLNPLRLTTMSSRNFRRSLDFRKNILDSRRLEFYDHLKNITHNWTIQD